MGSIFASVLSGDHIGSEYHKNQAINSTGSEYPRNQASHTTRSGYHTNNTRRSPPSRMKSNWNKTKLSRSMSVTTAITSSFAALSEISPLKNNAQIFHTASTINETTPPQSKSSQNNLRRHSTSTLNGDSPTMGRPAYVRYRSRNGAKQRTRPGNCPYTPPCDLVEHALGSQTEQAHDATVSLMNRLLPTVLTWYMEWILDLYDLLRGQSYRHSFWRWGVSCVTVSLLTLVLFAGIAIVCLKAVYYLSLIADGLVAFTLFLVCVMTGFVCFILIANYGVFK